MKNDSDKSVNADMGASEVTYRTLTRKEYFDEIYNANADLRKSEVKRVLLERMGAHFKDKEEAKLYIEHNMKRREHSLAARLIRLNRKVNLNEFNYFCTFTYDSKKQTEQTFERKLKDTFKNFCKRKGWKYVGVWERGEKDQRLHFHGLFYIPEGGMVGELVTVKDYSTRKRRMIETVRNTYFDERFGRSDFKVIGHSSEMREAVGYITKYLKKSGERIVYSKGLYQYVVSDIMDDDIVCKYGENENKFILFDDFTLWDEGCAMGKVDERNIKRMPKTN